MTRLTAEEFAALLGKQKNGVAIKHGTNLQEDGLKRFSSGIYAVDRATGGGYPFGKIILIAGPESSGKSTLAYRAIGSVQNYDAITRDYRSIVDGEILGNPGQTLLIDAEGSYVPEWVVQHGADPEHIHLAATGYAEEVGDLVGNAIFHNAFSLIVVDSIAALVTRTERDRSLDDNSMAESARILSRALRKWTHELSTVIHRGEVPPTILLINQYRDNVGVMYGPKDALPGGKAQRYYAAIRIAMASAKKDAASSDKITPHKAVTLSGHCAKNKTFTPQRPFEFEMSTYDQPDAPLGYIDNVRNVFKDAIDLGTISRESVGYAFEGTQYATQKELREALYVDPALYEAVRTKLMEKL